MATTARVDDAALRHRTGEGNGVEIGTVMVWAPDSRSGDNRAINGSTARGFGRSGGPETGPAIDIFMLLKLAQDQKSRDSESNRQ